MGSKRIESFESKFIEAGLTPLESIKDGKHKVNCVDKDGYKYFVSYHTSVGDKRSKSFNKWSKNNPHKAYNMRLYAKSVQKDCKILSSDKELFDATNNKILFECPLCGEVFKKKWCHWISMPDNQHVCPKCNKNRTAAGVSQYTIITEEWLQKHNIPYQVEYVFKDCKHIYSLRFDFYVEWGNKIILIEVDGMQHFYTSTWTDKKRLEENQFRDSIKDEYCKKNGYVLVRIPYWLYRHTEYEKILNKTFFNSN